MTGKELQAVAQQLQEEKKQAEAFKEFARRCTDPQLKIQCQQIAAKHQEHYNKLIHHLN